MTEGNFKASTTSTFGFNDGETNKNKNEEKILKTILRGEECLKKINL
jgi:hypothetical protein